MNIKDMYSVFQHEGKFAVRMLAWCPGDSVTFPCWSYLYLTSGSYWSDKWSFSQGNWCGLHTLKYFSSEKEAQDYIDEYVKDLECF